MPSSRESSWPRSWTQVFRIAGRFFTIWATWESPLPVDRDDLIQFPRIAFYYMKKTSLLLPIRYQHSAMAKGVFSYSWYQKVKGLSHRLGERSPTTQLPLAEAIQDEGSVLTSEHFWSPLWQQGFCSAMCSACLQPLAEVPGALDPDLFPQEGDQPSQFIWDWRSS